MSHNTSPPPFHVQAAIERRQTFPHHDSVSALWTTKWRKPCEQGIYPFVDGKVDDFDPIFARLAATSEDDVSILYDPDAYAAPFFPVAEALVQRASEAEARENTDQARELYLRAAAVYRIARFPINRSPLSEKAWKAGKAAYLAGGRYLNPPVEEVLIPHVHGDPSASEDPNTPISAFLRVRTDVQNRPKDGWPVILFICGLDGYKTDQTNRTNAHTAHGFAVLSLENPGTGDCPASPNDPTSPDRLFSSVWDWIQASAPKYGLDADKIVARGISTGSYNAFRLAHTHADRLLVAVAHGGGCHYMFTPEWIDAQNYMEYPFALADALAHKFGYSSVAEYKADAFERFSLVQSGLLDGKYCRLLVINGMEDTIFPIEDSVLVARRVRAEDVRLREDLPHMGNPGGEDIVHEWIDEIMKGQ